MKIKNLLLLGLMAVYGMNAFAADYKVSGIVYNIAGDGKTATVKQISSGMADATAATISIPATFTDGDGNTVKVNGFEATWATAEKDVTGLTKTLSIDITNFAAGPAATPIDVLTKLETLTITGALAADYSIPAFTKIKTLDMSAVTGSKKLTIGDMSTAANLATITLAGQEVTINANAFINNTKITTVTLGGKATIKANAFEGATALATVTLSAETKVEKEAFKGATKLASISMDKITDFGDNAFENSTFASVDLSGAKNIGATVFTGNAKVTALTIPAQVETIADAAFDGMSKLATVTINVNNAKTAGKTIGAWFGSGTIKTVTIESPTVETIAASAFAAEPIETLNFSAPKLKTINGNAFANYKAKTIDLSSLSALEALNSTAFPANAYTSVKLTGTALTALNVDLSGATASLEEIYLPAGLTSIPSYKFNGFSKLATVGLPKNLTTIGSYAFQDCTALTAIKIRGEVTDIYTGAFSGCTALAKVDFSGAANLVTIGSNAFAGTALTEVDLSACAKLASITYSSFPANAYTSVKLSGTALLDAQFNSFNFSGATTSLKELTLPAGITYIPSYKFQGFTALTSVSLPKNVTDIRNYAFQGSGLTAIKIRENVATIGSGAFQDCTALATANFSEATSLTSIGNDAFNNTLITEVAIPADAAITFIGQRAFKDCTKLKSFSAKSWTGIINPSTFEGDKKLGGFAVPAGITSIGNSAFKDCKNLTTFIFKEDVDLSTGSIGASAFEGCAALTALDLSTTKLANLNNSTIFKGCTSLATITLPEEMTELLGYALFADCPIENFVEPDGIERNGNLFGLYWDEDAASYFVRDADHPNTTLKTVTMSGQIASNCFAYCTALESAEYVEPNAYAYGFNIGVRSYAFDHCTALKTFTFEPKDAITWKVIDDNAFHGCIPFVKIITNGDWMSYVVANNLEAPINTTYGDAELTKIKTVQDKANANQFIAKFVNNNWVTVSIDANEAKVYSIYVDGETAYFSACRTINGMYNITPGDHVIIKTETEKEVELQVPDAAGNSSVGFDDIYASVAGDDLAAVQDGAFWAQGMTPTAGYYLYRLTNTDDQGFGFTYFSGTTIKEGQFFIVCSKKPEGAGRLTTVWLDEDGNVEGEATGIKAVKNIDANDGAIYNLQGVRVDNPVKGGLYIQNGKKIVVK